MVSRRRSRTWTGPCEVSVDVESRSGQPLIVKCGQPGEWYKGGPYGSVLCHEHAYLAERFAEQWKRAAQMMEKARAARKAAQRVDV